MEKWLKHIRKEREIRETHAVKVSISNNYLVFHLVYKRNIKYLSEHF